MPTHPRAEKQTVSLQKYQLSLPKPVYAANPDSSSSPKHFPGISNRYNLTSVGLHKFSKVW